MKSSKTFIKDTKAQFSVFEGFIIMWTFIAGGIVLTMALGTVMDILVDEVVDMNVGISEKWNTLSMIMCLVTDLHLILILFPVIGISIFIISILKRTKYDQYLEPEEEEF